MKIWNTKYCLTEGITEHEARLCGDGDMVEISAKTHAYATYLHGEGKEWHKSHKAALTRAGEVRIKKLISLAKQAKKITGIVF